MASTLMVGPIHRWCTHAQCQTGSYGELWLWHVHGLLKCACPPWASCAQARTSCCESLLLMRSLTCGVSSTGFERPSSIQSKGIVPFGKGLDVIQQAQSGTGKTATFCAGILQSLDFNLNECQALVLAPTRELAQQIEKVMRALGDYLQVRL